MSKRLSKIEIYSQADFQKADRIGRLRMHMIEPDKFVLNNSDDEYYRQLNQAYQLVFEELRQSVAIRAIQEAIPGAESWFKANAILRDIYELFAPFLVKNKDLRRAILVEKMYAMAQIAESKAHGVTKDEETGEEYEWANSEWMLIAERLYSQAAKLEGLDQHESAVLDPDEIQIPAIEITSDPAAFIEAQTQEAEEAEEDEDAW